MLCIHYSYHETTLFYDILDESGKEPFCIEGAAGFQRMPLHANIYNEGYVPLLVMRCNVLQIQ